MKTAPITKLFSYREVIMAEATSVAVCNQRHREYPFDVWEDSMDTVQRRRLETMFAYVKPGERVLDVGCNSGYAAEYLKGCEVHGVDVSERLVAKAQEKLAGAQVAPAEALPFEDDSFDVVALGEILEHVYDPVVVIKEAARVARRAIVGSTPTEDGAWGAHRVATHPFHVRCYDELSLYSDLGVAGPCTVNVRRIPHIYVFEVLL